MYLRLGENVSRHPIPWIVFWAVTAFLIIRLAPPLSAVQQDGEFTFLPEDSPSRQAERLFRQAFPTGQGDRFSDSPAEAETSGTAVQQDPLGSNIVIVLERDDRKSGLTTRDEEFILQDLLPALAEMQRTTPRGYALPLNFEPTPLPADEQVIKAVSSLADTRIGPLLTSFDKRATLVIVELRTEFLDRQNALVVERIEELLQDENLQRRKPQGLLMALSGSATVGRDMLRAESVSASRTEAFTKVLVICLLLLIYRAPLLALVPLVTVGVAVEMSKALLRLMAGWGWIGIFTGLDVYVTVVVYGAGVDYCLFLIARYKEELDTGATNALAMCRSIHRVGAALATSAGTSIIGIGMMGFSEFGKFRQAGFAISFGLAVVLCFALTFTPAFLLIFGKWAFWPDVRSNEHGDRSGWLPSQSFWGKLRDQRWFEQGWEKIAHLLLHYPATIFLATVAIMSPFALIGVIYQENLSFGLLSDLPQDEPSVVGAKVVQKHFPAGITGPVTLFIEFDQQALQEAHDGNDLTSITVATRISRQITEAIEERGETGAPSVVERLHIVDIRNQTHPLGTSEDAVASIRSQGYAAGGIARKFAHRTYTSLRGDLAGRVMRMDFVFNEDPFTARSMSFLTVLEEEIRRAIPAPLRDTAAIYPLGTTAGIRDLKSVTDRDRIRINILVVISVYLVLVALLRQPEICGYLIVSVVFSYLVTLGMTIIVFYLRDPVGFTGIDWKVPIYLFTILIAMGEDYNILLMARVKEEQETNSLVGGVLQALTKTGSIISSCGLIMAGTFCSLMTGELLGMVQLGFALAFGVMLDTFIVRPILVPAYLILLYSGRFGWWGRFLGAPRELWGGPIEEPPPTAIS